MVKEVINKLARINEALNSLIQKASEDGIITNEERKIIDIAKQNIISYEKLVHEAIEDNIITKQEELKLLELENQLLSDTYHVALEDKALDEDEIILLKILINSVE
ncbi:MAG: hypothetical protein OEZ01_03040 [Candidatus Heimdallarchaeota archaeon]|nr:hypothetical protein [Candidatus Heimdallarchaeota archaeon]MDH5644953.1 hypothetical protein [Candidatus Heimdallarchaeota archaeon]